MKKKNNGVKKFKIYFAKEEITKDINQERLDGFYSFGHSFPYGTPPLEWVTSQLAERYGAENVELLSAEDVDNTICLAKFLRLVKKKVLYTIEEDIRIEEGKIDECAKKVLSKKYGAEAEFIKAEAL